MERKYTPCGIEIHELSPPCPVIYMFMTPGELRFDNIRRLLNIERMYFEYFKNDGGKN